MCRTGSGIAAARTFDLRVMQKSDSADHVFSSIPKEEEANIAQYLKDRKVRVENESEAAIMDIDPISDDDDDEAMSIPSEDEMRAKKSAR